MNWVFFLCQDSRDAVIRYRLALNRLLHQPIEQQSSRPRASPVEPEHEFVEIGVEVLGLIAP